MSDTEKLLEERGKTHGEYFEHARCTQRIVRAAQAEKNWDRLPDCMKETIHMIAHKIGRVVTGNPFHRDHWDDVAGYAVLVSQRIESGMLYDGMALDVLKAEPLEISFEIDSALAEKLVADVDEDISAMVESLSGASQAVFSGEHVGGPVEMKREEDPTPTLFDSAPFKSTRPRDSEEKAMDTFFEKVAEQPRERKPVNVYWRADEQRPSWMDDIIPYGDATGRKWASLYYAPTDVDDGTRYKMRMIYMHQNTYGKEVSAE